MFHREYFRHMTPKTKPPTTQYHCVSHGCMEAITNNPGVWQEAGNPLHLHKNVLFFNTEGPRLSCSTSRVVAKMTKSVVARTCLRRFKLLVPLSSYSPHNSTGMQEHHHSQHVLHARNLSVDDPDARKNVPCSYTSASRVQAGNIVEDRTRPGQSPFPAGIRVGTASTTLDIYNEGPPSRAVAALMPPSAAPSPEGDCPISHKLSSIVNSCSGLSFLLVTCRWY